METLIAKLWERVEAGGKLQRLSGLAASLGFSGETFIAQARRGEIPAVLIGARWFSEKEILLEGLKLRAAEAVKPKSSRARRSGLYQQKRAAEMKQAGERLKRLGVG